MKYCNAVVLIKSIENFKKNLKKIDIEKADKKRDGAYTVALTQLDDVLNNRMDLEHITHPDNILRNIMILSYIDKNDCSLR